MNLTQTKQDAKNASLDNRQQQMIALYRNAATSERVAIIKHIDSFFENGSPSEKIFWLKFRLKLEILKEQSILFPLGNLFLTVGAKEALSDSSQEPLEFLTRHQRGDWGDVWEDDADENNFSLKNGFRILSVYKTNGGEKLWIITEADRSVTTILLPSEY